MNAQQFAAAEDMHHALSNVPCICQWNIPYEGSQVKRVLVKQCAPCRTIAQWKLVREVLLPPVNERANQFQTLLSEATRELSELVRDPGRPLGETKRVLASITERAEAVPS